jgi:hypothetical protein
VWSSERSSLENVVKRQYLNSNKLATRTLLRVWTPYYGLQDAYSSNWKANGQLMTFLSKFRSLHSKFVLSSCPSIILFLVWCNHIYCSFHKMQRAYMLNLICYIYMTRDCPLPNSPHFFLTTDTELKRICLQWETTTSSTFFNSIRVNF